MKNLIVILFVAAIAGCSSDDSGAQPSAEADAGDSSTKAETAPEAAPEAAKEASTVKCPKDAVKNGSPCTNPEGATLVCNWCVNGTLWAASCNGSTWLSMNTGPCP
jgi:hypothetical protein